MIKVSNFSSLIMIIPKVNTTAIEFLQKINKLILCSSMLEGE